jgi:nucleotide-binding universal stress UspA family protein/CheY-like chemotaxis protein
MPTRRYIAIIDDDESMCRSLSRLLQQSGFQSLSFLSAEEFLADPVRDHFACLLVDIQLAGMSGLELHRELIARGRRTPVIFITAHDDPAARAEAQGNGCAAFFRKTDPGPEIILAIHRATAGAASDEDDGKLLRRKKIESIFHPSDFSAASEIAFEHALKLALAAGATLNMLHVDPNDQADWKDFPGVRATLERWKLIPEGSPRSAVGHLGIGVTKVIATSSRPVAACLDFLTRHPADLIVLAVHQHEGHMRWLEKRVGEPMARRAGEMTLYLPQGVSGFVSREDGSVSLRSILIPIAIRPRAGPAVDAVIRMIRALKLTSGTVTLLHVGAQADAPSLKISDQEGWAWEQTAIEGEPAEVILQTADKVSADLIVMTTEGRNGFLDALRGSTSERVLRRSHCPVASLPAGAN